MAILWHKNWKTGWLTTFPVRTQLFYCSFEKLVGFWVRIERKNWPIGEGNWLQQLWKLLAIDNIENALNLLAENFQPEVVLCDESNALIRFLLKWTPEALTAFIAAPTSTFQSSSNQLPSPLGQFFVLILTQNPTSFSKLQ